MSNLFAFYQIFEPLIILGAQFSAVGFCGQVTNSFSLNDHGNKAGVISAINSLQSAHGKYTGIGVGLQVINMWPTGRWL